MISICTLTANVNGNVDLAWNGEPRENTARMSRTATLDLGAVINHMGVSDGDRTISIRDFEIDEDTADKIWDIFTTETMVYIGLKDGFFLGAIKSCKLNNGLLNMTILLESKESA